MSQRFYMVWNPAGRAPTFRHPSYEGAMREARRLARMNPSEEFIVLAAVATAKVPDMVKVTPFTGPITVSAQPGDDEIPF
ncbi:hypothetical protein [Azorhizobium sp. AG788]|uniref:hypothetical protein n=1 Tax=Azorhizobium sp. AG788 TaxID=2183897 RepID=UPI00313924EF